VKIKVILRPTVSRPVRPGVRHPSGTGDQFFPFSVWLFFRQFRGCWCGAPSLTKSRVCTFQFFPGIVSASFLRSQSHGSHEHSLLSLFFRLPQPGGPGSCIYFPQEQGIPVIPNQKSQSRSYVMTDSQSASLFWCQVPIWDPRPIFPLLSLIIFRQLRVCWRGAPSLTRGRVCNLQCNDASSISSYTETDGLSASSSWCRDPNGAHDQILISLLLKSKVKNYVSLGRDF
jgi:hypothetical protein